ncbi:MAG: hypothetical protein ABIF77_07195, partial [bacterium]
RIKASPNPGHCESRDVVALKFAARLGETEIRIYSVDGRWVRTLQATDGRQARWDLRDAAGKTVPAGVYGFLTWQGGETYARGKVTVIK